MMAMVVMDGTLGSTARQARSLEAFVSGGLRGATVAETVFLYADDSDRDVLVSLAPAGPVRLIKVPARRVDLAVPTLAETIREQDVSLVVAAPGSTGMEIATRLGCRTGGTVLTDVLSAAVAGGSLECTRSVYSSHMVARFELRTRPWCLSIDAGWADAAAGASRDGCTVSCGGGSRHGVVQDVDATGSPAAGRIMDVALLEGPSDDELAASSFLVVAGRGAGSREGVERIAAAAERMGAAFGVTRPVVMNGWAPMDRLVGVSGTRASPALCIVAGASGAGAFQWGIEKAGFIVAVNPDARAPMVADADVAVLDDGVSVLEELARIVAARDG